MFDKKEYNKKRYLEKREYILNQCKEYYKNNKEKYKLRYLEKREYLLNQNKEYCENHKEKRKLYLKEYNENHKKYVVYQYIELNSNEICYIGSTCNINRRICHRLNDDKTLFAQIYKNNPTNYKLEIICECETREDAYEIEYQLIIKHNPKYNIIKYKKYT